LKLLFSYSGFIELRCSLQDSLKVESWRSCRRESCCFCWIALH